MVVITNFKFCVENIYVYNCKEYFLNNYLLLLYLLFNFEILNDICVDVSCVCDKIKCVVCFFWGILSSRCP